MPPGNPTWPWGRSNVSTSESHAVLASFRLEHVYRHPLNPLPLRMLKHVLRCLSPLYRMKHCLYKAHSCFCIHPIISRLLTLPTKTLWCLNHIIQGIMKRKWHMNTVNIGVIFFQVFLVPCSLNLLVWNLWIRRAICWSINTYVLKMGAGPQALCSILEPEGGRLGLKTNLVLTVFTWCLGSLPSSQNVICWKLP